MRIAVIVGGRPQFIKAAVTTHALEDKEIDFFVIHTGQHYDYNMSQKFFEELGITEPKYNLGVSGGGYACRYDRTNVDRD